MNETSSQRDFPLADTEYCLVQDAQSGMVKTHSGPMSVSLSGKDRLVVLDTSSGPHRFVEAVTADKAKQQKVVVPESSYAILANPAFEERKAHPSGGKEDTPKLAMGQSVVLIGPDSFSLWPSQIVEVVEGHSLRKNEYLLIRVINEEAAKLNWDKAVVKARVSSKAAAPSKAAGTEAEKAAEADKSSESFVLSSLAMIKTGDLHIVKGTDVSFYIPQTGIEVVRDEASGDWIRDAVTLEAVEYCVLVSQEGRKRFENGPQVVFPEPTESFIGADSDEANPSRETAQKNPLSELELRADSVSKRKFRAIELNEKAGVYVRVIADYTAPDIEAVGITGAKQRDYVAGEELFITGEMQPIYWPRAEHMLIGYSGKVRHYAVAIPSGQGRYVLNRLNGRIRVEKGEKMLLPDPRTEVIVRRTLSKSVCALLYPGNSDVVAYNVAMGEEKTSGGVSASYLSSGLAIADAMSHSLDTMNFGGVTRGRSAKAREKASSDFAGDVTDRGGTYSEPRSITLDGDKFNGVVAISPWKNYAAMLVRKDGTSRVVESPETALLEYDEEPHALKLSTGTPKSDRNPLVTAYLRVKNNSVSDLVTARTKDYVDVTIKVTYVASFTGDDKSKWFGVDDYTGYLCDRMRSMIMNCVGKTAIGDLFANSTDIIRDLILGKSGDGEQERPGRRLEEIALHISNVDVFEVTIHERIKSLLIGAQQDAIQQALALGKQERDVAFAKTSEGLKRALAAEISITEVEHEKLQREKIARVTETQMAAVKSNADLAAARAVAEKELETAKSDVADIVRGRDLATEQQRIDIATKDVVVENLRIGAEVSAVTEKAKAITPDMIAALQRFGDDEMTTRTAEALAPLKMLGVAGGKGILEVIGELVAGSQLSENLVKKLQKPANGSSRSLVD